jgi:hypothetical protein
MRWTLSARTARGQEKKILEQLNAHLTATIHPPPPPDEFEEFKLAIAMGCLVEDIERLPEEKFQLYRAFLRTEESAARLKAFQKNLYG